MKIQKPLIIGEIGKWKINQDIQNEFKDSWIFGWKNDCRDGLHCSNCGEDESRRLLSNASLPRVLCIRCYSLLVMLYGEAIDE